MDRLAVLCVLSLLIGGCMPQTLRWYAPVGAGEAIPYGCGVPTDVMKFGLDDHGSELHVSVRHPADARHGDPPHRNKASLSYHFLIAAETRIVIPNAVLVVRSLDGNELGNYPFKSLTHLSRNSDGYELIRSTPVTEQIIFRSEVPTAGRERKRDSYIVNILIPSPPTEFVIHYPDINVNGALVQGPVVKYTDSQDLFFRRRCLF